MKKAFYILLLAVLTSQLTAQDAVNAIKEAGLDAEVGKVGLTVPDAVEKAREVGYSDQDILEAIEKTKGEARPGEEINDQPEQRKVKESLSRNQSFREWQNSVLESYNIVKTPKSRLFVLPPFGYEIFNKPPASFEPLDYGPADPNYQIGPEDELVVSMYGDVQASSIHRVDREGKINLAEAGMVIINGLTLAEAQKKITERLSLAYAGIKSRTVSVDVTLGKLKRIKIFVMGEVRQPGGFTISSTSTAFTALYYAGGPTNQGSLRRVQVLRNNKTISTIDIYDLILKGKKDSDVRLQNGDVVYVPLAPKKVAIPRGVNRPGIYEPLPGEGLKAVLALAGGLRPDAYTEVIQLNRTGPDGLVNLIDLPYKELSASPDDFELENEDVFGIFKVPEGVDNIVNIDGFVLIPGSYQISEGTTLGELIDKAGGLLKIAYRPRAEVSRMLFYARPESTVTFCLDLDSEQDRNFPLKYKDRIIIRQDPDYQFQKRVMVDGMVNFPGYYSLAIDGERLSTVIRRAGGLKHLAYPEGSIFNRAGEGQIDVDLNRAMKKPGSLHDIVMRDGDVISIPERPATVNVSGEVRFPVNTIYEPNRGYKHYLEKVGGTTEDADRSRITVRLPNGRNMKPKSFWGLVQRDIPAGSSIIVPKKKEGTKIKWGDVIQSTTAILTTTVVIIVGIDQLKN